jgi:hypothetical protein
MYCLTRIHGRSRGGSSKILDAVAASEPGGANVTLNYFWLSMISFAWACHASALGEAAAPSFGATTLSEEESLSLHGVVLPSTTRDVSFAEFMRLPHSARLGATMNRFLLASVDYVH